MSNLKDLLQNEEKPVYQTRLHGIYLMAGVWWFVCLAGIGWISDFALWHYAGDYILLGDFTTIPYVHFKPEPGMIGWLFTAGGVVIFLTEFLKFISTHLLLTSKRLLYKTGFINTKLDATDIVDILGVHVDQGWFGQFLGYGKIHLDCRFIEDVYIPYVKNPYGVTKMLQKIRQQVEDPSVSEIIGDNEKEVPKTAAAPSQTLIQITGSSPVYFLNGGLPDGVNPPLNDTSKNLGNKLLKAFRSKA